MSILEASLVQPYLGLDAIGGRGVDSSPTAACVTPPPFGTQCTMHARHSVWTCLALASCNALTCPSPEPYHGGRRDAINGPICQARSIKLGDWQRGAFTAKAHGMCKPSGCRNFFLERVQISAEHAATIHPSTAMYLFPTEEPISALPSAR